MIHDKYDTTVSYSGTEYIFTNIGENGSILKGVQYALMPEYENTYNLAFGDLTIGGKINDISVTNNGDIKKVLATVVETIYHFTNRNPSASIFFKGSTYTRTQLYNKIIYDHFIELEKHFTIFGFESGTGEPERYDGNKKYNYEAFIVIRK